MDRIQTSHKKTRAISEADRSALRGDPSQDILAFVCPFLGEGADKEAREVGSFRVDCLLYLTPTTAL
jgi:hypothetical protein